MVNFAASARHALGVIASPDSFSDFRKTAAAFYEKVAAMNKDYYDLRGKIVKAERRLAVLDKRLEMWAQYEQYKPIRQKLDKVKPGKREKYQQEHRDGLALFDAAAVFLKSLKESGEAITPKCRNGNGPYPD